LPRFGRFLVVVFVVFVAVVLIVLVEVVIVVFVGVVDRILKNVTARHSVTYAFGSAGVAAGAAAAGFGGGYVVQK
jgi:hypothetical protein